MLKNILWTLKLHPTFHQHSWDWTTEFVIFGVNTFNVTWRNTFQPRCSLHGSLVSCSGSQMVDWNVNPSPLDGAVVGTRERWGWVGWGGTRLYADVNKNSHFPTSLRIDRPFKTLRTAPRLDHARLLDWNNVFFCLFFFRRHPGERRQCWTNSTAGF